MKRIILFASILVLALSGAMVSCYFDAARDNPNDPENIIPSDLHIFRAGTSNGDLDGRDGINAMCVAARNALYPNLPSRNVIGFISVDANDSISNMPSKHKVPTDRPVYGPNLDGTGKLANNWADLLDNDLGNSLFDAGILPNGSYWWSGSNGIGTLAADAHCVNWNSSTMTTGTKGFSSAKDSTWISSGSDPCTTSTNNILCICWDYNKN